MVSSCTTGLTVGAGLGATINVVLVVLLFVTFVTGAGDGAARVTGAGPGVAAGGTMTLPVTGGEVG